MLKRFTKRKILLMLLSLLLIGFFIGYDFSILTAKPYGESILETPYDFVIQSTAETKTENADLNENND